MKILESEKSKILSMLSSSTLEKYKILKKGQRKSFFEIMKWGLLSPFGASPGFILEGRSGSGKTFLTGILAEALPKVVLTATTNKAAKEVKKAAPERESMTIYSLLGLRMEAKEDTLVLKTSHGGGKGVQNYRFVFLDEAGMTPKSLKAHIEQAMRMGVRFLFIGDRKQIPPVGEKLSYVWDSYPTTKLTKVLRHDNQILDLATHVRKTKLSELDWKSNNKDGEGVWCLSSDAFVRKLQKYAGAGFFDSGEAKAVAWKNKTVDTLNHIIRLAIFQEKIYESKYLVGDRIVFTSPYSISNYVQAVVDDEGIIENVQLGIHPIHGWQCYFLTLKLDIGTHIVKVLHENSEPSFEKQLNSLAQKARASKQKDDWFAFWQTKDSVAYVKYSHALTAHRAQGSTYKYAFVKASDIMSNSNSLESKKCLYTSITRPTTRLFLN